LVKIWSAFGSVIWSKFGRFGLAVKPTHVNALVWRFYLLVRYLVWLNIWSKSGFLVDLVRSNIWFKFGHLVIWLKFGSFGYLVLLVIWFGFGQAPATAPLGTGATIAPLAAD